METTFSLKDHTTCSPHVIHHMWHSWHRVRYVEWEKKQLQESCITVRLLDVVICVRICVYLSVCVKWCFLKQLVVLSMFSRGCCCGVLVLPWAADEKAAVLITWSTRLLIRHTLLKWHLLITPSYFRNSFLDFIQAPSCSLSCRNKQVGCCGSHSLFDWKLVSKHTNRHLKSLQRMMLC